MLRRHKCLAKYKDVQSLLKSAELNQYLKSNDASRLLQLVGR